MTKEQISDVAAERVQELCDEIARLRTIIKDFHCEELKNELQQEREAGEQAAKLLKEALQEKADASQRICFHVETMESMDMHMRALRRTMVWQSSELHLLRSNAAIGCRYWGAGDQSQHCPCDRFTPVGVEPGDSGLPETPLELAEIASRLLRIMPWSQRSSQAEALHDIIRDANGLVERIEKEMSVSSASSADSPQTACTSHPEPA